MRRWRTISVIAVALLAVACTAGAQVTPVRRPTPPRPPRKPRTHFIRVSLNAGFDLSSGTVDDRFTHLVNAESATTSAAFDLEPVPFYDFGADIRLTPHWAIGGSVDYRERRSDGDVTAQVPHPFFFNRASTVRGTFSDLNGQTLGVHVQIRWFRPVGRRLEWSLSGGPSVFDVQQEFVTDVLNSSVYPYDTAVFGGVTTTRQRQQVVGFNAGSEMIFKLSKYLGAGGVVRYAMAQTSFTPVIDPVTITVGGVHVAGGLRVTF